jgi:tetratricopeptide (TPR) repeat protein
MTIDPRAAAEMREAMQLAQRGNLAGARQRAEAALGFGPNDPGISGFLGMLCCQAGDLVAGVAYLRASLAGNPADGTTRANLIMALLQSGQADEALALADPAAADKDPSRRIWRLRGYLLQEKGDHAGAASAYERVVAAAADDFESWNNLGNARGLAGDTDGGIVALQRAARLRPDLLQIRLNLGTALVEAGRSADSVGIFEACTRDFPQESKVFAELGIALSNLYRAEEAVTAFTRAVALAPTDPDLLVRLGENQASVWALDLAEEAFARALAIDAGFGDAHLQRAILFEQTNRAGEFPALLADAQRKDAPDAIVQFIRALACRRDKRFAEGLAAIEAVPDDIEPARRMQMIGEFHDRLDEPERAFAAFTEMNRLRALDPTDPLRRGAVFREELRADRALVTPAWYAGWRPAAPPEERPAPVFLVGFPRSGTTLLDTMLMGHERVQVLEERPPLRRIELSIGGLDRLADLEPADIADLRRDYFREAGEFVDLQPDSLLVDKFPMHLNKVPLIHRLFPDARFILALRHPYDVVLSCYITSFRLNNAMVNFLDLKDAAATYDLTFGFWEQCRAIMPINVHTLVYERLVEDKDAALRPLFDYLGLDWPEAAIDHQRTAAARGTIITASYAQVTEPIYRRAAGRWERYREQMAEVLPILRPWAEKMGYEV